MRRRDLLVLVAGAITLRSLITRAQQKPMPAIGFLNIIKPPDAFWDGIRETGYVEGQNVRANILWSDYHNDRLPAIAADLVAQKVDIIVTVGTPGILAAKGATSTIPIVFW
jgi:putative ABC transport system substrate-binding protein